MAAASHLHGMGLPPVLSYLSTNIEELSIVIPNNSNKEAVMRNLFVTFVLAAGLISSAKAQTVRYVFPGESIQDTINVAVAGDTIKVATGLYTEQLAISKKLHLVGVSADSVFLLSASNTVVFYNGSAGSSIRGFNITSTSQSGIAFNNHLTDIVIADNIIRKCALYGINCFSTVLIAGNVLDSNNVGIHANGTVYNYPTPTIVRNTIKNSTSHGIKDLRGMAVANTLINNGNGDDYGIEMTADEALVAGNVVQNTQGDGIRIDCATAYVFANDIQGSTGKGITSTYNGNTYWKIRNNLIRANGSHGLYWEYLNYGSTHTSSVIANNVIYQNGGDGIAILRTTGGTPAPLLEDVIVKNNIVTQNGGAGINRSANSLAASDFILSYNDFYNNTGGNYLNGFTAGTTDFSANPQFVNPAGDDFHLQGASPCVDAGLPMFSEYDLNRTRNDLGVYGGSYTWTNYFNNPAAIRVIKMDLSDNSVIQGQTIQITGKGVAK